MQSTRTPLDLSFSCDNSLRFLFRGFNTSEILSIANFINEKKLTTLYIGQNSYYDSFPKLSTEDLRILVSCPTLTEIHLEGPTITEEGMRILANSQLTNIDLRACSITDDKLKILVQNKKITTLSFRENKLGEEGMKALLTLPLLKSLDVGWANLNTSAVIQLATKGSFDYLGVAGNPIEDIGIISLFRNDALNSLDMRCLGSLSAHVFKDFHKNSTLEGLMLQDDVTDEHIADIAKSHSLKTFFLISEKATNVGLSALAKNKSITHMSILNCRNTSEEYRTIVKNAVAKNKLDEQGLKKYTDKPAQVPQSTSTLPKNTDEKCTVDSNYSLDKVRAIMFNDSSKDRIDFEEKYSKQKSLSKY